MGVKKIGAYAPILFTTIEQPFEQLVACSTDEDSATRDAIAKGNKGWSMGVFTTIETIVEQMSHIVQTKFVLCAVCVCTAIVIDFNGINTTIEQPFEQLVARSTDAVCTRADCE